MNTIGNRRMIDVTVFESDNWKDDFLPVNLAESIGWLNSKLLSIPEEYRNGAQLELDIEYDGGRIDLKIRYTRPETNEEFEWRRLEADKQEEAARVRHIQRIALMVAEDPEAVREQLRKFDEKSLDTPVLNGFSDG